MISGKSAEHLKMCFECHPQFHDIRKTADTANTSRTLQLAPKQPRWINDDIVRGKISIFNFGAN